MGGCESLNEYGNYVEKCSLGNYILGCNCLTKDDCLSRNKYIYNKKYLCLADCEEYYEVNDSKICVDNCDNYELIYSSNSKKCLNSCPSDYFIYEFEKKKCLEKCPEDAPHYYSNDKKCVKSCGENYIDFSSKECVSNCQNIKVVNIKTCFQNIQNEYPFKIDKTNEYVEHCGNYNNTEYIQKYGENICVKKNECSGFFFHTNNQFYCVTNCPNSKKYYLSKDRICLEKCPNSHPFFAQDNLKFICLSSCPDNNPFDNKDKVSKYKYKIEENNECVKMCNETNFKYKIEEKKECVKTCNKLGFEYKIEETKECEKSCENTKFPITILHNKTCVKSCPKDLDLFNSNCYLKCPEETHKIEGKNICECNNLFYIEKK